MMIMAAFTAFCSSSSRKRGLCYLANLFAGLATALPNKFLTAARCLLTVRKAERIVEEEIVRR